MLRPLAKFVVIVGMSGVLGAGLGGLARPAMVMQPARPQPALQVQQSTSVTQQIAGRAPERMSAVDAVSGLPDALDLVLVADDLARARTGRVGEAAVRLLTDNGAFQDVDAAWSALATQLGWSRAEAFDAIMGRRVVLVSRSTPTKSQTQTQQSTSEYTRQWAMLCDVSISTELRLKDKLRVATRSIDQGHRILSVESGAFELTSHRRQDTEGSDAVTLVLAPSGDGALFDDLVAGLAKPSAAPLGGRSVMTEAAKLGECDILLLANTTQRETPAPAGVSADTATPISNEPWSHFVCVAAKHEREDQTAWRAKVLMREPELGRSLAGVPSSSTDVFDAMSPGSLMTIVQPVMLPRTAQVAEAAQTAGQSAKPLPLEAITRDAVAKLLPGAKLAELVPEDGRIALSLKTIGRGDQQVVGTLALELASVSAAAPVIDAAMARTIGSVERSLGVTTPAPMDFQGVAPSACRTVRVVPPENSPIRVLVTEPIAVSWQFGKDDHAGAREQTGREPGEPRGWCLMTSTTVPEGSAFSAAEVSRSAGRTLLSRSSRGEVARWLFLASFRPAELNAVIPAAVPDLRGVRTALRGLEVLSLRAQVTEASDIAGEVYVRMVP